MKKYVMGLVSFMACIGLSFYLAGCGEDDGSGATAVGSYAGPGSHWSVTLNSDNTFLITRAASVGAAVDLTVNGTYATLSSGFMKLTVTSATGTDAPSAGDQAYALNVPGLAFLLKPMGNDGEIIPMISSGVCPTTSTPFNWVVSSHENSGDGSTDLTTNKDLVGTATFDGSTSMTLNSKYDLQGTSLSAGDIMTGSCSNGVISLPGQADIYLSTSGAGIVSTSGGTTIVAMPQETLTLTDLNGEYSGLVFNESNDPNTDAQVDPVWLTFNSAGTTEANGWSDVDAGTKETTGNVTFSSITANSPANGFVSMTMTDNAKTAPMTCQAATNVAGSGKNILFCVGVDAEEYNGGAGTGDELYSVLLISQ